MHIGEYIKDLRKARHYSQRKLGLLSRVSNTTIKRMEDGAIFPKPVTLRKLAPWLGVSYEELMNVAGYLEKKEFVPSNITLLLERGSMNYAQLTEAVKRATGVEIDPGYLQSLEEGKALDPSPTGIVFPLASYVGVNPDFFYRENTSADLEAAAVDPSRRKVPSGEYMGHIEDGDLKEWICDPDSVDYLVFAKKVSDLGLDPEFVYRDFVSKVFKSKGEKG